MIGVFFSPSDEEKEDKNYEGHSLSWYLEESEKQLAEILESIEGVGKVKVMITLKNDGVNIVDKKRSLNETET